MTKIIQMQVGGFDNNYSYLIVGKTKDAVLIDPTGSKNVIERSIRATKSNVKLVLFTHSHPDHCELAGHFASKGIKTFFPSKEELGKTIFLDCGEMKVECLSTPGHTLDSVCYLIEKNIFTGDTLFVRGVGTTAYGGNDELLEKTLAFLSELNPSLKLWPGHNYGGEKSTLKEALDNSHIKPNKKTHEIISKMVEEYNSKHTTEKKF